MLQKLGLFSKKLFLKSPWARMQKYFKTNASASWELSNTKTLKAFSALLCLEITIKHPFPCLLFYSKKYVHVEYDPLLDGVPREGWKNRQTRFKGN